MAVNAPYFLDAADLTSATAVYLDADLAYIAPDGFYRDGTVVRQQSSGILLAVQECSSCTGLNCSQVLSLDSYQGVYLIDLDEGSAIGAIVIKIDTNVKPEGIRAIYNGIVYNKLSSPVDGLHQSSNYGHFTVVGQSANDCALVGNNTTLNNLNEYLYDETSFVSTGDTINVTINSTDVSLSSTNPNYLYMVIPKPTATPNILNIQILGACTTVDFDVTTYCPVALPSFLTSNAYENADIPCNALINFDTPLYFAKVHTAADTYVGLYDYVFLDANGQYPLADGFYLTDNVAVPNKVIEVVNGIIVAITNCI